MKNDKLIDTLDMFVQKKRGDPMKTRGKISCLCGDCSLVLTDCKPKMSLLCACEDCRQAVRWAEKHGGKPAEDILYLVYCRSDFSDVSGLANMRVTQLRKAARSTRIYCGNCYSCLGIDHPAYSDNVFMFKPDYCSTDFETKITPSALGFLCDYPGDVAPVPSDELPVFHTLKYPQERKRFLEIHPIKETFSPPKTAALGETIRQIIASFSDIENLGLQPGQLP